MKITASLPSSYDWAHQIFNTQEEFETEPDRRWNKENRDSQGRRLATGWYAREEFRDPHPDQFPCLMMYKTMPTQSGDGPYVIENFFLYEFEIHEEAETNE